MRYPVGESEAGKARSMPERDTLGPVYASLSLTHTHTCTEIYRFAPHNTLSPCPAPLLIALCLLLFPSLVPPSPPPFEYDAQVRALLIFTDLQV